jgi:hypothetical protein
VKIQITFNPAVHPDEGFYPYGITAEREFITPVLCISILFSFGAGEKRPGSKVRTDPVAGVIVIHKTATYGNFRPRGVMMVFMIENPLVINNIMASIFIMAIADSQADALSFGYLSL